VTQITNEDHVWYFMDLSRIALELRTTGSRPQRGASMVDRFDRPLSVTFDIDGDDVLPPDAHADRFKNDHVGYLAPQLVQRVGGVFETRELQFADEFARLECVVSTRNPIHGCAAALVGVI
jgi:hypothetical protein